MALMGLNDTVSVWNGSGLPGKANLQKVMTTVKPICEGGRTYHESTADDRHVPYLNCTPGVNIVVLVLTMICSKQMCQHQGRHCEPMDGNVHTMTQSLSAVVTLLRLIARNVAFVLLGCHERQSGLAISKTSWGAKKATPTGYPTGGAARRAWDRAWDPTWDPAGRLGPRQCAAAGCLTRRVHVRSPAGSAPRAHRRAARGADGEQNARTSEQVLVGKVRVRVTKVRMQS